jgi:hypothetical protein
MKIKRILLTIAVLIGLPLFLAMIGFFVGNWVGMRFFEIDYAMGEAIIGFVCGGYLGLAIGIILFINKIRPHNTAKKDTQ